MSNAKLSLLMISPPLFHPHCTQDLPKKLRVCVLFGRGGCSYVPQLIGEVNNLIPNLYTICGFCKCKYYFRPNLSAPLYSVVGVGPYFGPAQAFK